MSRVMDAFACPSIRCTALTFAPALTARLAAVCRKSLLDAARHWVLRVETCQVAECEASSAVSAAADWAAHGRRLQEHNEFCADRPWMKRRAS